MRLLIHSGALLLRSAATPSSAFQGWVLPSGDFLFRMEVDKFSPTDKRQMKTETNKASPDCQSWALYETHRHGDSRKESSNHHFQSWS